MIERSTLTTRRQRGRAGFAMHTTIASHLKLLPSLEIALRDYDDATSAHSARVGHMAGAVATTLDLPDWELEAICWAGFLHDLGKLAIAHEILERPGPLTTKERREVQRHTVAGAELLLSISPLLGPIAEGVRSHHERWDGTGYPDRLAKCDIPRSGRIIAVADVFDSVTHTRNYRAHTFTPDEAIDLIATGAGSHFDPAVAERFLELRPWIDTPQRDSARQPTKNSKGAPAIRVPSRAAP